ncbi:MAG: hypothetical protein ACREFD_06790 [Stellaceae bacterium]
MVDLLRIVTALLRLGALSDAIAAVRRRVVVLSIVGVASLLSALGALTWLSIALYLYCTTQISPPLAAVVTAGAFLIILLAAGLVAMVMRPRRRTRRPPPQMPYGDLMGKLERIVRENRNSLLLAAIVAGLAMGVMRPRR